MSQQYPYDQTQPQQPQQPQQPNQPNQPQWAAQPQSQAPYQGQQPSPYGYQAPQQPGHQAPPPHQGAPKKKSWPARHPVWTTLGSVVVLFIVIGIAASGGGDKPAGTAVTAAPQKTKTAATPKAADKPADKKKPAAPPAEKKKPAAEKPKEYKEYKDGDYIVGDDIPAGTYTSAGAKKGLFELCSISTAPTGSATMPQLKVVNANERIIITLTKADGVVTISGCEPLKGK